VDAGTLHDLTPIIREVSRLQMCSAPFDAATLRDLDVLSTSGRQGPTVFSAIDRTRTRAGREALCRRLVTPASSPERIAALQRAHQFLAADAATYRALLDRPELDALERYLSSNWQLPSTRPVLSSLVTRVWRPAWFRQYLGEVEDGQVRVAALLRVAAALSGRFSTAESVALRDVGTTLASLIASSTAGTLARLGSHGSASNHLALDQLARGPAKGVLTDIVRCMGAVEAMWSIGVATAENGWSYPTTGTRLQARGLVHPFLGADGVSNDIELDDAVRVCFVTGPNMAGKSTFLKAVAIALLLGHVGCGVPARSMEFRPVGTLFSSVQIADNLSAGESFYLAEVRRIGSLAAALRDHGSLVAVIDEPFRGTNVHDAAEATLAVISRLLEHDGALVFVASHLGEIVPAFAEDPRVRLLHFSADVATEEPTFDYRLREGISAQRLGMVLLKREGVLELLEQSSINSVAAQAPLRS
jgi:DNA mismatch repair protein MutS